MNEQQAINHTMEHRKAVPYSMLVFFLGIFSLLFAAFVIGGVSAVFTLWYAKKAKSAYKQDPSQYKTMEYVKTGKAMSIVAIVMAFIILSLWIFSLFLR